MLPRRSKPIVPAVRLKWPALVAISQRASSLGDKKSPADRETRKPNCQIIGSPALSNGSAALILQANPPNLQCTFWLRHLFQISSAIAWQRLSRQTAQHRCPWNGLASGAGRINKGGFCVKMVSCVPSNRPNAVQINELGPAPSLARVRFGGLRAGESHGIRPGRGRYAAAAAEQLVEAQRSDTLPLRPRTAMPSVDAGRRKATAAAVRSATCEPHPRREPRTFVACPA